MTKEEARIKHLMSGVKAREYAIAKEEARIKAKEDAAALEQVRSRTVLGRIRARETSEEGSDSSSLPRSTPLLSPPLVSPYYLLKTMTNGLKALDNNWAKTMTDRLEAADKTYWTKRRTEEQQGGVQKRTRSQNSVMVAQSTESDQFGFASQGSVSQTNTTDRSGPPSQCSAVAGPLQIPLTSDVSVQGSVSASVYRPPLALLLPRPEEGGEIIREEKMDDDLAEWLWGQLSSYLGANEARRASWKRLQPSEDTCILNTVVTRKNSQFSDTYRVCKTCRGTRKGQVARPCAMLLKLRDEAKATVVFLPLPDSLRQGTPKDRTFWVQETTSRPSPSA